MPRGPFHFESKGACVYCGISGVKLTDEHIVPYSLGGSHVIRQASCGTCANITKRIEQRVARDLWGDARTSFNAPTRRKRERKSHIVIRDAESPGGQLRIPASEYPAGFVFYKMSQAGLLQGLPEDLDISGNWKLVVIDDAGRRRNFLQKHPGKLLLQFRHVPDAFGRLLAKIGYGQVLTTLDPGDFRPICLPYVMGERRNVSFVVGGTLADVEPEPHNGYSLKTVGFGTPERVMLVALVRLYANTHAPAYHVVVGDVVGSERVARVVGKLGPGIVHADDFNHDVNRYSGLYWLHWLPQGWPLPFWAGAHSGR